MAQPRAVIDVVGADASSKHSLQHVVLFVRALGGLEHREAVGATLVTKLGDILDELGPLPQEAHEVTLFDAAPSATPQAAAPAPTPDPLLSDRQRIILAELDGEPIHIDSLIERTALPANEILQDLTVLSLKGIVKRVDGQAFVRAGKKHT